MSLSGFIVFCLVYALAVATPGPGVAAVLARSFGHGSQGASGFIAGFAIGDLVWFTLAATGLAAIAERAQPLLLALKYAGAVYLIYLAYRLWTAPTRLPDETPMRLPQTPSRLFLGSLVLTLGNPKPMIFFLALLPSVVDLSSLSLMSYLQIALAIIVILPLVLGSYVLAASQARRFFRSTRAVRMVNRGSATAMAGAAAVVVTQ